jgi:hypothetical protein
VKLRAFKLTTRRVFFTLFFVHKVSMHTPKSVKWTLTIAGSCHARFFGRAWRRGAQRIPLGAGGSRGLKVWGYSKRGKFVCRLEISGIRSDEMAFGQKGVVS